MQRCRVWSMIGSDNADMYFLRGSLRVAQLDVEIATVVEHAGVEQREGRLLARTAAVFLDQPSVRVFSLRILVEIAHPAVGGRGVEVEVVLFHILSVVALIAGESECALLQDRVAPIPERQREAQPLLLVADAAYPI